MSNEKDPKPVGRPSKYKPEYCKQIIDFFDRDYIKAPDIVEINEKSGVNEKGIVEETTTKRKKVGNTLPTFERFAFNIGVHIDTMIEWCRVHDEFSEAYKRCKQMQKDMLVQNSLGGLYNTTFAIFLAKNITDLRNDPHEEESKSINITIDNSDASM